jgi:hypothetical protein
MAIIKCKECGGQVSTKADACPACGAKQKKPVGCLGWAFVILVFIPLMIVMFAGSSSKSSDGSATAENQAAVDQACLGSLQCIAEKKLIYAHVACPPYIERLAKNSVKWADEGFMEKKFSRYKWSGAGPGNVTYLGDKVQFQNGFGAYINMVYACEVDVAAERVVKAEILFEGKL